MPTPNRLSAALAALRDVPALAALSRRVYPPGAPQAWRRRLRMLWAMLRQHREHRVLAAFFAAPTWAPIAQAHPQLLRKVHQPFARHGLTVAERVDLVCTHYRQLHAAWGEPMLRVIATGQEWPFCRVALPAGQGELPVRLSKQRRFEREGELTLSLFDPFGSLLYSACVTLGERDGAPALLVGSLNGTAPREVLRHITRLSHGLRPASLMVYLVQLLAARAGVQRIDAVGVASHAYVGHPRHAEIRFDYDAFWREEGGEPAADGLWRLPLAPRRRPATELPSHKRAQYLRRYAWLDEVARAVRLPGDPA